jgi:hypothetical protein
LALSGPYAPKYCPSLLYLTAWKRVEGLKAYRLYVHSSILSSLSACCSEFSGSRIIFHPKEWDVLEPVAGKIQQVNQVFSRLLATSGMRLRRILANILLQPGNWLWLSRTPYHSCVLVLFPKLSLGPFHSLPAY